MRLLLAFVICSVAPLLAQKDFLTADEVDQVREAQEPNARLKLYLTFAQQRLDQVQSLVKDQKPGRAGMIHDLLEQYNSIIDAIDTVSDDALQRKLAIDLGMKEVTKYEAGFLPVLESIRDSNPKDLSRYEFMLTQAIESTRDSLETSKEDLGKRSNQVADREQREKKELQDLRAKSKEEKETDAAEAKKEAEKPKRKPPTLLKPGETIKKPGQQ